MTQTPYKLNALPSDLIMDEYDPRFCCEQATMSNTTSNPLTLPLGLLCNATVPLTAAEINAGTLSGAMGLLIKEEHIPAGESVEVTLLARGPAIVNKAKLPALDAAGAAITANSQATFLATNFPTLLLRTEPAQISQQTT